jgi:hypothetical protein
MSRKYETTSVNLRQEAECIGWCFNNHLSSAAKTGDTGTAVNVHPQLVDSIAGNHDHNLEITSNLGHRYMKSKNISGRFYLNFGRRWMSDYCLLYQEPERVQDRLVWRLVSELETVCCPKSGAGYRILPQIRNDHSFPGGL